MPLGKVRTILACGDGTGETPVIMNPGQRVIACPSGTTANFAEVYVINPSEAERFNLAFEPFDYTYASGLWTVSFSMVVGLYVVSRKVGALLGFVRHG